MTDAKLSFALRSCVPVRTILAAGVLPNCTASLSNRLYQFGGTSVALLRVRYRGGSPPKRQSKVGAVYADVPKYGRLLFESLFHEEANPANAFSDDPIDTELTESCFRSEGLVWRLDPGSVTWVPFDPLA